jgi:hypothetical protein
VDQAATATTAGSRHKECTVCEYKTATGTIPATGAGHIHDYSAAWSKNATQHWHECSCGDKADVGNHTGNPCSVCGYASGITDPVCECTIKQHFPDENCCTTTGTGKLKDCDCTQLPAPANSITGANVDIVRTGISDRLADPVIKNIQAAYDNLSAADKTTLTGKIQNVQIVSSGTTRGEKSGNQIIIYVNLNDSAVNKITAAMSCTCVVKQHYPDEQCCMTTGNLANCTCTGLIVPALTIGADSLSRQGISDRNAAAAIDNINSAYAGFSALNGKIGKVYITATGTPTNKQTKSGDKFDIYVDYRSDATATKDIKPLFDQIALELKKHVFENILDLTFQTPTQPHRIGGKITVEDHTGSLNKSASAEDLKEDPILTKLQGALDSIGKDEDAAMQQAYQNIINRNMVIIVEEAVSYTRFNIIDGRTLHVSITWLHAESTSSDDVAFRLDNAAFTMSSMSAAIKAKPVDNLRLAQQNAIRMVARECLL